MRGSRRRVAGGVLTVAVLMGVMLALPATASPQTLPATLVGAGDIASCGNPGDEATAELLDRVDGTVFTLGDNVYDSGTAREFARCYDPTWGRHKRANASGAG